ALALLALLVNPRDEVAFRRVVNKPARGIGPVTADKIIDTAEDHNGNLLEACKNLDIAQPKTAPSKARTGLDEFIKVIEAGKNLLEKEMPAEECGKDAEKQRQKNVKKKKSSALKKHSELMAGEGLSVCIAQIVKDSGIAEYHRAEDDVTANNRISNLQELVNAAIEYPQSPEGLLQFLEDIELDRSLEDTAKNSADSRQNSVTLITFHNTKGLEFRRVIMTGLEHGIFPRDDKKGEDLEEERRLFYVGATRAMDELYLTNCAERRIYGKTMPTQPSLFIREIDKNYLQIDDRVNRRKPIARHSFNPYNFNNKAAVPYMAYTGSSAHQKKTAQDNIEKLSGWQRGQRLYHENYGYGAVMEVKDSEDGPVVNVRFDNGKETRFLSEYQGRAFEKMGNDA
ncbi:MAG: ATP-binding domain-containing protein, partial [Treponema sp.]|nr:ATP-binding domain-containing protein [Treponema sp.]